MQTLLTVYKPMYLTPLQVIDALRLKHPEYKESKIGYAGRLDPLAHGVLLLMVGEEAKKRENYLDLPKTYEFEALFGLETDTYDLLGIVNQSSVLSPQLSESGLSGISSSDKNSGKQKTGQLLAENRKPKTDNRELIQQFIKSKLGTHTQPYPPFSSKAVGGKPLHWWAKQERLSEITIPTREITIYSFELLSTGTISMEELKKKIAQVGTIQGHFRQKEILERWHQYFSTLNSQLSTYHTARFRVSCSSGTYVRGLVHELGQYLGTGAVTTEIFRTQVGEYTIKNALNLAIL